MAKNKTLLKFFISEFVGTFILILFGNGSVITQNVYNQVPDVFNINIAYGLGVTFGIYTAYQSGGHLNPAVTLCAILYDKMDKTRAFIYILGQFLGAMFASFILHVNYSKGFEKFTQPVQVCLENSMSDACHLNKLLDLFHPYCNPEKVLDVPIDSNLLNIAGSFSTFPHPTILDSKFHAWFDQIVGTFILLFLCKIVTDKHSPHQVSPQSAPLIIGLIVVVIGQALGVNCGYAINPARDLGPRIYMAIFTDFYSVFDCANASYTYWIVPVFATILGAILGNGFYRFIFEKLFLETQSEEIPETEEMKNLKA